MLADLHIHSRFSRAVSREMTIPTIATWAKKKGIGLVATGDWTHPLWLNEIESQLEETGEGFLHLRKHNETDHISQPLFLLSTELSCIFSQGGKTRRVHTMVWVPTIASARKISQEITKRGGNVLSDGRPILGFSLIQLADLILSTEPNALIVPAHIWTPWFSVYGAMGGFSTLAEAFGPFAKHIYAVETGLSSSPDMNWRIQELKTRSIVSFSDAHSAPKLGREATLFSLPKATFPMLREALMNYANDQTEAHIVSTMEFYPEEGKYHYTGHRDCHVRLTPKDAVAKGAVCSVCGKPLTQGVMQRVEELASIGETGAWDMKNGVRWRKSADGTRPPFVMLVPLQEIISEAIGSPVTSPKVAVHFERLTKELGGEFSVLLDKTIEDIARYSTPQIADGIWKVRSGDIVIDPGYDGVFGVVKIWKSDADKALVSATGEQMGIF